MKKLLIAASFALALPATAQATTDAVEAYCQDAAAFAESIAAQIRDAGLPPNAAYQVVNDRITDQTTRENLEHAYAIIEFVYDFPRGTPAEEGNTIYYLCLAEG